MIFMLAFACFLQVLLVSGKQILMIPPQWLTTPRKNRPYDRLGLDVFCCDCYLHICFSCNEVECCFDFTPSVALIPKTSMIILSVFVYVQFALIVFDPSLRPISA